MKKDRSSLTPAAGVEDVSRRGAAGAFLAIGAAALAGCATSPDDAEIRTETQALSGADLKWVDTVLGAYPPAARTGDLATHTNVTLGASMAFAKGCVTVGDGGGGLFIWDSTTPGTDNGGTVVVPNGAVGTTGACWRRINL